MRRMSRYWVVGSVVLRGSACSGSQPFAGDMILRHQRRLRQGRGPRRPRRCGPDLPDAGRGRGRGGRTWRAYLEQAPRSRERARPDRGGPWANAKGVVIAKDVAELHGANNLTKQTALTEKGDRRQRSG